MRSWLDRSRNLGPSIPTAVALLILLLALYGLSYSGRFSTDDEHILASRSIGLAFDGSLNDDRVLGNDRIYAYHTLPPQQSSPSLEIEPLQSFLGVGLIRLAQLIGSGYVQTLFLLNILATALAAICVFTAVRVLDYSYKTALVTALFFGLGTQAWPYTRTFFRDPLAMLFLAFAWVCALKLNHAGSRRSRILAGIGVLVGLLLGVLTKNTVVVALPAIAILLIPFWKTAGGLVKLPLRTRLARPGLFLTIAIILAGLLAFLLTARGSLARFSLSYYKEILLFFITSPHPQFLAALFGPLVSPGKSLFVYSPVLLLSLAALVQKRIEVLAAWGYVLLLIIAQALFYDGIWWGNINWGLRFLAPAIPLLTIASASVIHRLLHLPKGWIYIALLGGLSALVQLIGISTPLAEYYLHMISISPQASGLLGIWDPGYSALVWTASRILSGGGWDLANLRAGLPGLLTAAGLAALACLAWLRLRSRPNWMTLLLLGCTCLVILLLPKCFSADSAYYPSRNDFQAAQGDLQSLTSPVDGLVISSYGTPAWYYWINWGPADLAWVSLPFSFSGSSGIAVTIETILAAASRDHELIWMLLPCDSPPSAALLAQKDQLVTLELVAERSYQDGTCRTSLLLFHSR